MRFAISSIFLLTACGTEHAQLAPQADTSPVIYPDLGVDEGIETEPPFDSAAPTDSTTAADSADATSDTKVVDSIVADVPADGACFPCTASWKTVEVEGRSLAFDSKRLVLYTGVHGAALKYSNELVGIDPATSTVKSNVAIGSDPLTLAITEDSQVLYVGLHGAKAIRPVDLSSGTPAPGTTTSLKGKSGELAYPSPIVPFPGSVSRRLAFAAKRDGVSPSFDGVYIMDSAGALTLVPNPKFEIVSRLSLGPGANTLLGYDHESSAFSFTVIDTSTATPTLTTFPSLMSDYDNDLWWDGNKLVYAKKGEVIDVTDPTKPTRVGKFAYKGMVLPLAGSRALMVSPKDSSSGFAVLRYLDAATFTQKASVPLTGMDDDFIYSIVPAGTGKIAFTGQKFGSAYRAHVYVLDIPGSWSTL